MGLTISCDLNFRRNFGIMDVRLRSDAAVGAIQRCDFRCRAGISGDSRIQPVGFKAVDAGDTSFVSDLPAFEEFGQTVSRLVPRCRKIFLELRNSITSNHNLLAAVLYSDGALKHTGIYDIEHEIDRVARVMPL